LRSNERAANWATGFILSYEARPIYLQIQDIELYISAQGKALSARLGERIAMAARRRGLQPREAS
jgi:hypothetical protein